MSKVAIAIGAVLVLGAAAYAGTEIYLNRAAEQEVAEFAASVSDQADFRYRSVRTSLWNRNARVEGIAVTFRDPEQTVLIDKVEVEEWDFQNDPPTFGTVTLSGMRFDPENADAEIQALLTELEYGDLKSDLSLSYALRDNEADFAMQWRTASLFDFSFDMQLLNLNLPATDDFDPASLAAVSVGRLSLVYTDDSFLPRTLDYLAAEEGSTVAEIKGELSSALTTLAEGYPGYTEALTAVQAFIDNPNVLSIDINPDEPVTPLSLMLLDPSEWPSRLNLQVSAR